MRIAVVATAVCLALAGLSVAADADAAMKRLTNIRAQRLDRALQLLAEDRGLAMAYRSDIVGDRRTDGASGQLTIDEALTQLLTGTGLAYLFLDDKTVTIVPVAGRADGRAPSSEPAGASRGAANDGKQHKSFWSRFWLAQADTRATSRGDGRREDAEEGAGEAKSDDSPPSQGRVEVEEVVVTGSHIRGSQAAGSKLILIDRQTIDASGYGRVEDVLGTLTQVFSGVGEEAVTVPNGGGVTNNNRGAEVQLRGLGVGTTLTLVNGQRQAPGGSGGTFTDISSIPTSAIERIEILPEGASALYGSDAIGGVVNIILRKDFEGFETRVRAGTASGAADELQFAQIMGGSWSRARALVGYQYSQRDPLPASERELSAANGDFTRFGGRDYRTFGSNPGTLMFGGRRYAIPSGQDGTQLTLAQLVPDTANYTDNAGFTDILPEQTTHSAFLSASYDMSDRWTLFVEGRHGTREVESLAAQFPGNYTVPAGNAFNFLGAPAVVAYDFTRDLGPVRWSGKTETSFVSAGTAVTLPGSWQLKMSGAFGKERSAAIAANQLNSSAVNTYLASNARATALNLFGQSAQSDAAILAAISDSVFMETAEFTTSSANLIVDGSVFDVPAGTIRLAVGSDFRREHRTTTTSLSRDVVAVFGEVAVPIVGSNETGHRLDLSLAGRYEDYSDFGTTFDPKVGLSWVPLDFLKLRGTWGTSFRAPALWQLSGTRRGAARDVTDPLSAAPNRQSHVLVLTGPDPDMHEETADVWTAGMDFTVPRVENLALSLTYFDIDYNDKISVAGSFGTFLAQEEHFAPVITRNPADAQVAAICSLPGFLGPCSTPFAAILDNRRRNLSGAQTRGLDVDLSYGLATSLGRWDLGLRGTYTFDLEQQLTSTTPVLDVIDTPDNPLALRSSGRLAWSLRNWTVQTVVNYMGSYSDPVAASGRKIDSWTTLDLNIGYDFDPGRGWFADTRVNLGAVNILDKDPPFVDRFDGSLGLYGYDSTNANLLGRQISLQVIKGWR